jgi:dTMP kinase
MRALVLSEAMQPDTEALLLFAARAEHVQTVIQPALQAKKWVVSDRFTDASYAYQGGGRGIDSARLAALENWTLGELQPDLTFLFDVPEQVSQARLRQGRMMLDRFEQEKSDFHLRVRAAYLARANAMPTRFCILDGTQCIEQIQAQMLLVLHDRFGMA